LRADLHPVTGHRQARGARAEAGTAPESHVEFLQVLTTSRLLVPVAKMEQTPDGQLSGLEFVVIQREGKRSLPAFTDDEAVRLYFGDAGHDMYILNGRELCDTANRASVDSVLLNPGGPVGYDMPRHEFFPLAEGLTHVGDGVMAVPEGTDILIGTPSNLPISPERLESLRAAVQYANASSAYWNWVKVGESAPCLAIVVAPPTQEVMVAVQQAIQSMPNGANGFVLPMDDSGLSRAICEAGELLYEG
jgi:hypothetical protein